MASTQRKLRRAWTDFENSNSKGNGKRWLKKIKDDSKEENRFDKILCISKSIELGMIYLWTINFYIHFDNRKDELKNRYSFDWTTLMSWNDII